MAAKYLLVLGGPIGHSVGFEVEPKDILEAQKGTMSDLIHRRHPLTRKGVVNQVKLLRLVHTFVTVSLSNVQKYCMTNPVIYEYLSRDKKFTVVREVLHNNYCSCNLIDRTYHFWRISPCNSPDHFLTGRNTWTETTQYRSLRI